MSDVAFLGLPPRKENDNPKIYGISAKRFPQERVMPPPKKEKVITLEEAMRSINGQTAPDILDSAKPDFAKLLKELGKDNYPHEMCHMDTKQKHIKTFDSAVTKQFSAEEIKAILRNNTDKCC